MVSPAPEVTEGLKVTVLDARTADWCEEFARDPTVPAELAKLALLRARAIRLREYTGRYDDPDACRLHSEYTALRREWAHRSWPFKK